MPGVEVKKLIGGDAPIAELAHLAKLVHFCMRTRVVLSAAL